MTTKPQNRCDSNTFVRLHRNHVSWRTQNRFLGLMTIAFLGFWGCSTSEQSNPSQDKENVQDTALRANTIQSDSIATTKPTANPLNLTIPDGFVLYENIQGDLNGDGVEDYALIIKGTKKENIVQDEYRGELDRNRRGILIYLSNKGNYDLVTRNLDCFASENEDGGVYFPPELSIEIKNGKLYIAYGHGRYGHWKYTFRYQNASFELIGFDASSNHGPVVVQETSINFMTKRKLTRQNVNAYNDTEDAEFEETWEDIEVPALHRLNQIKDFAELKLY